MTKTPLSQTADLNLDFYRKKAKALLRAARAGDAAANARLKRYGVAGTPALHAAQRAIAREQGFASWPRFQAFVTEAGLDVRQQVDRFIDAATSDGRRARDMLADHPEMAEAGVYVALVLGDWERVADAIAADEEFAVEKSGSQGVEPLVYVCFSRFGHAGSPRAERLAMTVRLLLSRGADANTAFMSEDGPLSCLYAASGLLGNAEMTRLLLEAGADPNDGESVYHACEHADLTCLKLLLAAGGKPDAANALKHMLDWERPEGVRLLLEHGANPNMANPEGDTALHWAVRRRRSVRILGQLLEGGADIDAVRGDGRTAYAMAVVDGQAQVAAFLAGRGADARLSAMDAFVAGLGGEVPAESAASPENARLLTQLAEGGNVAAVTALLRAGVPVDARGDGGITALHYACWRGDVAMIRVLMESGAPTDVRDEMYGATPAGFLHHGATNCGLDDYAEGARVLLSAGVREWDTPSGNAAMDAVLREAGLIG